MGRCNNINCWSIGDACGMHPDEARVECEHYQPAEPCPMGCGGLTHDPGGGPCKRCWGEVRRRDREKRAREREHDEQWRRDIAEMQDSV